MKKLKPYEIGVITLLDESGDLFGLIYKDPVSHKNIFYKCSEMSFADLKDIFDGDDSKL